MARQVFPTIPVRDRQMARNARARSSRLQLRPSSSVERPVQWPRARLDLTDMDLVSPPCPPCRFPCDDQSRPSVRKWKRLDTPASGGRGRRALGCCCRLPRTCWLPIPARARWVQLLGAAFLSSPYHPFSIRSAPTSTSTARASLRSISPSWAFSTAACTSPS